MPEEKEGGPCRFTELRAEGHKTRSTRLSRSRPISILFLALPVPCSPPARGRTRRQKHEPHWKCHYTGICLYFLYTRVHTRIYARVCIYVYFLRRIPRYCAFFRGWVPPCALDSHASSRRARLHARTQPRGGKIAWRLNVVVFESSSRKEEYRIIGRCVVCRVKLDGIFDVVRFLVSELFTPMSTFFRCIFASKLQRTCYI